MKDIFEAIAAPEVEALLNSNASNYEVAQAICQNGEDPELLIDVVSSVREAAG